MLQMKQGKKQEWLDCAEGKNVKEQDGEEEENGGRRSQGMSAQGTGASSVLWALRWRTIEMHKLSNDAISGNLSLGKTLF